MAQPGSDPSSEPWLSFQPPSPQWLLLSLPNQASWCKKQAQQSKGCAEIKSLTIQPLTVHCSATWVEATRADVLIWRWLGQTARSCERDWWREDMGKSGGKPFWEQEVNRISAQLALSSITGHFFCCRRGTAKSTAIGDPFRNGLCLPQMAAARQGQGLLLGEMGRGSLVLLEHAKPCKGKPRDSGVTACSYCCAQHTRENSAPNMAHTPHESTVWELE